MRRLLVNDALSQLGEVTFWHRLRDWFGMEFVGGDYATLANVAKAAIEPHLDTSLGVQYPPSLIIRNATWFPPIDVKTSTISLLQDIVAEGPVREMQEGVIRSSHATVFNSAFTEDRYPPPIPSSTLIIKSIANDIPLPRSRIIPLPVDFSLFTPQNALACQQALSLPDGCICWIGASQGAAGHVKGFDIFLSIVRQNPDLSFVAVFKDAAPESLPPNLRAYVRLTHAELVKVIGACRVGLCTSRTESQHLAGVEMGGCGLPIVAPPVGVYWKRNIPGEVVTESTPVTFATGLRAHLARTYNPLPIHEYWRAEFGIDVVRAAWTKLVEEVENDNNR